ncbi:ABC transporter substrate-binding protein [Roseomonas sp. AR75]|uniref:ABC transporter substrate-binding protein n=1 Tax=Roseomonas sp. AR75 TaxID=2562311 RepID=UPI0010C0C5D8|nr:ABC transporter substrate-binding protein [Roseomonas sp. AR75]
MTIPRRLLLATAVLAGALGLGAGGAAAQDRTMVMAMVTTPRGFDPDIWVPGQIESSVNVYEGLTRFATRRAADGRLEVDPGRIEPHLAESWTVSEDGKEYLFRIRPGMLSPFGNELTSADVVWTFEKSNAQRRTGLFIRNVALIDSVEAVSKYEVRFRLTQANRIFLSVMTLHIPALFDSTEARKHATADDPFAARWLAANTAGFGPYHAESVQAGQQAVFVFNQGYQLGRPHFTRVVWRQVPSAATRVALVRTGQVQYAEQIPLQQIADLRRDRNVRVESTASPGSATVRMNPRTPPFDDVRVRQAVAYATDYKAIGEAVFLGLGTRSRSVLNPPIPGAVDSYLYETDYDRARQLLREAGHPDGIDVTLEYSTNWWWEEPLVLQMQASLARAGIRVTPKRIPATEMTARRAVRVWSLPFMTHLTSSFVPDPSYNMFLTAHSRGGSNVNGNNNEELDRLIDASVGERDDARWREIVAQAQRSQAESATFIETFLPGTHEVFTACMEGYLWLPHNRLVWKNLSCRR